MYASHCHNKCHNKECIQHALHSREATADRNSNKAWNLQMMILSWFGIVDFFSFDNRLLCLNDSSFTHQHSSLLHCVLPYALLEWNNSTATSHPEKHIISRQQQERHCTTGTLTSYPVARLVNKDLYWPVGADLELSRQLRRNVGRKGAVCWNTKSPLAWSWFSWFCNAQPWFWKSNMKKIHSTHSSWKKTPKQGKLSRPSNKIT